MIYNVTGGGGGTGAALTVTAPAGATVTVSKDGKSKTKVADTDGVTVFKGLSTGDWTLSITDGTQTAQKTVTITADYTTAITFFAATIHVTYPAGSTCTATDGVTTLTAPDTSGTWDCVVPNAGTWTVTIANGGDVGSVAVDVQRETDYLVFIPDQSISWDLYNLTNSTAITDTTRASVDASNSGTTINLHPQSSAYKELMARKAIDLTNWSQIILDATITIKNPSKPTTKTAVGVFSGRDLVTGHDTGYVSGANTFDVSLNADISALSGEYYIGAYVHTGSSSAVLYSTIVIQKCILVR